MSNTKGFRNEKELMRHHADHGVEFGSITAVEYGMMADDFWLDPRPAQIFECTRKLGDRVRFDPSSDTFSVMNGNRVIRTFFKPVPCVSVTEPQRTSMRQAGRCHPEPDNLRYFYEGCKQR